MSCAVKRVSIEGLDLGVAYEDIPPWRSFELTAYGKSADEMLVDATISEIDQDGGEIRTYRLEQASNRLILAAENIIRARFS